MISLNKDLMKLESFLRRRSMIEEGNREHRDTVQPTRAKAAKLLSPLKMGHSTIKMGGVH